MRYECFSLSTEIPLKRFAFGPNLVTVAPPEFEIYGFVKVMWLSESDTSSTYGWARREIFSKVCVFCPSLVTADSQEVEIWTFPKVTGLCDNDITSIWESVLSVVDLLEQLYLLPKFGDHSPSGKYISAKKNENF